MAFESGTSRCVMIAMPAFGDHPNGGLRPVLESEVFVRLPLPPSAWSARTKDPFDVALSIFFEVPQDELEEVVRGCQKSLCIARDKFVEERERLAKKGFLSTAASAIFWERLALEGREDT